MKIIISLILFVIYLGLIRFFCPEFWFDYTNSIYLGAFLGAFIGVYFKSFKEMYLKKIKENSLYTNN